MYTKPTHPGAMTPAQLLTRAATRAAIALAILATITTFAALIAATI